MTSIRMTFDASVNDSNPALPNKTPISNVIIELFVRRGGGGTNIKLFAVSRQSRRGSHYLLKAPRLPHHSLLVFSGFDDR
jgi:hypothetical protein